MKRLLCLTAVFGLMSTAAFGQGAFIEAAPDTMQGTNVYLRSSGADADSASLADLVSRALDKSRTLHLVAAAVDPQSTMEVQAPVSMTKEADGKRVRVTYEITPKNSTDTRTFTTTCAITQMDRCAEDIATRAERIARQAKATDGSVDGV